MNDSLERWYVIHEESEKRVVGEGFKTEEDALAHARTLQDAASERGDYHTRFKVMHAYTTPFDK